MLSHYIYYWEGWQISVIDKLSVKNDTKERTNESRVL
jgi:hypothetical protein